MIATKSDVVWEQKKQGSGAIADKVRRDRSESRVGSEVGMGTSIVPER